MSKKLLFDFGCTADPTHVFEELIEPECRELTCPRCGELAKRLISGTHVDPKMGLTNDFPTMARKWEKKTRQRAKTDKVDGPNLWMY
jgi:hypothetical protein